MPIVLSIALKESGHYLFSTLAQIAIVVGLVVPLLSLLSVQNGIITDLRAHLESMPENLRLRPVRGVSNDLAWFEDKAADPRIRFIGPHPYRSADEVELPGAGSGGESETMTLLASGPGDPFLPDGVSPPGVAEAVITRALAERAGFAVGDRISIAHQCQAPNGSLTYEVTVTGTIPRNIWFSRGALVNRTLMDELYLCRQGYRSTLFDASGDLPPQAFGYPRFRLYAASLRDVRALASELEAEGVTVVGQFATADLADAIERTTILVTGLVTLTLFLGAGLALLAAFQADSKRLQPALATLRMEGLSAVECGQILAIKGVLIAGTGIVCSLGVFTLSATLLNARLEQVALPFATTARLDLPSLLLACGSTAALPLLAAVLAAFTTTRTSPVEDQHA